MLYFELLTGETVFCCDSFAGYCRAHCAETRPDLRRRLRGVGRAVVDVIARGTRRRSWERYASAAALLSDLQAVLRRLRAAAQRV
jgi:hypothetical protein